jgi:hypothetical protein
MTLAELLVDLARVWSSVFFALRPDAFSLKLQSQQLRLGPLMITCSLNRSDKGGIDVFFRMIELRGVEVVLLLDLEGSNFAPVRTQLLRMASQISSGRERCTGGVVLWRKRCRKRWRKGYKCWKRAWHGQYSGDRRDCPGGGHSGCSTYT